MDAKVEKILREKYMCISAKLQTHQKRYQQHENPRGTNKKITLIYSN